MEGKTWVVQCVGLPLISSSVGKKFWSSSQGSVVNLGDSRSRSMLFFSFGDFDITVVYDSVISLHE